LTPPKKKTILQLVVDKEKPKEDKETTEVDSTGASPKVMTLRTRRKETSKETESRPFSESLRRAILQ
jgi:hypothetical protein